MTPQAIRLEPCPGHKDIRRTVWISPGQNCCAVQCECGWMGPVVGSMEKCGTHEEAVEAWNRRTLPTGTSGEGVDAAMAAGASIEQHCAEFKDYAYCMGIQDTHIRALYGEVLRLRSGEVVAWMVEGPYTKAAFSDFKTAEIYRGGLNKGYGEDAYKSIQLYRSPVPVARVKTECTSRCPIGCLGIHLNEYPYTTVSDGTDPAPVARDAETRKQAEKAFNDAKQSGDYIEVEPDFESVTLDGCFDADELRAVLNYMDMMRPQPPSEP